MKLSSTPALLLIASFGIALNLLPLSRREMRGNGQTIPKASLTAGQSTEVARSISEGLREPVSTGNVQCDQNWLSSRSAELISPAGVRASVELRGKTLAGKTTEDNRCETTWILHLTDQGPPQVFVVDTRDDEWYYEHIFEMNAWSKDGTLLLMSQIEAAGDWDQTTPVIYNIQDHRMWLIELAPLFDNFTPKDCSLYFRPLGFTSSGKVLLNVGSLNESDLEPGEKPCFQNSRWELAYTQKRVSKVSSAASFERFGTVAGKGSSPAQD
jgi:hypothetical protein